MMSFKFFSLCLSWIGLVESNLNVSITQTTLSPSLVAGTDASESDSAQFSYNSQGLPLYPLVPSSTSASSSTLSPVGSNPTSSFVLNPNEPGAVLAAGGQEESSATPSYASCVPFPSMHRGLNATEWDIECNRWNSAQESQAGTHIKYWADCAPVVRLSEIMYDLDIDSLPNEHEEFSASGFVNGEAVWFIEAENRSAEDPVIFYLHGGGYLWGLFPNHIDAVNSMNDMLNNSRVSWLVIDYTLTNVAKWPQQLQEAVVTYNSLVNSSDNIIVFTDSNGAHLGVELLIHMHQPFANVDAINPKKPMALAMSSPWMDFLDNPAIIWSYIVGTTNRSDSLWMPPTYSPGQDTSLNWTDILPSRVFLTYGENEPYRAWVEDFVRNAKLTGDQVYMQPGGNHDELVTQGNRSVQEKVAGFLKTAISNISSDLPTTTVTSSSSSHVSGFTTSESGSSSSSETENTVSSDINSESTIRSVLSSSVATSDLGSMSRLPTLTISISTPTAASVSSPVVSAAPSCSCDDGTLAEEAVDGLKKAADSAFEILRGGIDVFNLSNLVNSVKQIFSDFGSISSDIECISYTTQVDLFNAVDRLLDITHELVEGIESLGVVELIESLKPSLSVIIQVLSDNMVTLGSGLSLHPCCVVWDELDDTGNLVTKLNDAIDDLNFLAPLKLPHASGLNVTIEDCSHSSRTTVSSA